MSKLIFAAILDESGAVIGRAQDTDCERVVDIAGDTKGRDKRSYRLSRQIEKLNLAAQSENSAYRHSSGAFWVWS